MNQKAIGIDIGGTRTKIGLVNLATGRVERQRVTPTETKDAARFLAGLAEAVEDFKAAEKPPLAGVGIGVPGFVFADGTVDSTYGFLEFMEDFPLTRRITEAHGLPCRADNDARLVALGEARYGAGRGHDRVLVLTLGTGLGVGFVVGGRLDGALAYGHMGGHLTVATSDHRCYCGKTGCLEALVSASGVCALAARRGWVETHPDLPLTAEAVFTQRRAGNPVAEAAVADYLGYLRTGIGNFVNLFAPDLVVLGGGVAKGLKFDTDRLHDPMWLKPYKSYCATITTSALDEQAGILGSAALFSP